MHANIDPIREACLDFVDTLWTSRGAFHGTWADDVLDCEYTYYGLLALGHLLIVDNSREPGMPPRGGLYLRTELGFSLVRETPHRPEIGELILAVDVSHA